MTKPPPDDDQKVGYRRPPRYTRWKKGQSGNPRKKTRPEESVVELIDRLLLQDVRLVLNGEMKTVPALEAIVSQLQLKEMAGSARASKTLLKYRAFASAHTEKQFQLVFKDSEDMRPVANPTGEAHNV